MTQLDIFNTIPVARILVHIFEKLKAKENGRENDSSWLKRLVWRVVMMTLEDQISEITGHFWRDSPRAP